MKLNPMVALGVARNGEDTETNSFKVLFGGWPAAALCLRRLSYTPKPSGR
jgi:hypothetical protein